MLLHERRSSLIELLHPNGFVRSVRIIGSACEDSSAFCPQPRGRQGGRVDLVLIAPTREEGMNPDWLRGAVEEASQVLDLNGIVYILSDRYWRGQTVRLLRECGLQVEQMYLHHPRYPDTELLIPASFDTIAYAYSRLIHTNPTRRKLALTALSAPGALEAARQLLAQSGLLARWPDGAPSLSWLPEGSGEGRRTIAQGSWRGPAGAVLLHSVDGAGAAASIAKLWISEAGAEAFSREAAGLRIAGSSARIEGSCIPRLLREGAVDGRPYLVESIVPGEKAAQVLVREPARLPAVLADVADWLGHWNARTARVHLFGEAEIEQMALGPARALGEALGAGSDYEARLRQLGSRLLSEPSRTVATHGDLTMVNVLLDEGEGLGIIDWETASPAGLPLTDWFYAAVDAVAAVDGYRDRLQAWEDCFGEAGTRRELIASLQAKLADVVGLTPEIITFSFHACWLQHALDERSETAKTAPDEFLRIAQRAAALLVHSPGHSGGA